MTALTAYQVFTRYVLTSPSTWSEELVGYMFGLILIYNLCIGNITPPVGNTLFVGIKVGRTTLAKVLPYMLIYYVAIIAGLLLVTYIPAVSMILPQLAGLA